MIAGRLLQGAGAISATLTALIADATREEVRTRSMAVFGVGIGMSFMIAMIAGPLIAGQFGVPALFWLAAALAIVAALMLQLLPATFRGRSAARAGICCPRSALICCGSTSMYFCCTRS